MRGSRGIAPHFSAVSPWRASVQLLTSSCRASTSRASRTIAPCDRWSVGTGSRISPTAIATTSADTRWRGAAARYQKEPEESSQPRAVRRCQRPAFAIRRAYRTRRRQAGVQPFRMHRGCLRRLPLSTSTEMVCRICSRRGTRSSPRRTRRCISMLPCGLRPRLQEILYSSHGPAERPPGPSTSYRSPVRRRSSISRRWGIPSAGTPSPRYRAIRLEDGAG